MNGMLPMKVRYTGVDGAKTLLANYVEIHKNEENKFFLMRFYSQKPTRTEATIEPLLDEKGEPLFDDNGAPMFRGKPESMEMEFALQSELSIPEITASIMAERIMFLCGNQDQDSRDEESSDNR